MCIANRLKKSTILISSKAQCSGAVAQTICINLCTGPSRPEPLGAWIVLNTGSRARSGSVTNTLANGRLAGLARVCSFGDPGFALFFVLPQLLVQHVPDILA